MKLLQFLLRSRRLAPSFFLVDISVANSISQKARLPNINGHPSIIPAQIHAFKEFKEFG